MIGTLLRVAYELAIEDHESHASRIADLLWIARETGGEFDIEAFRRWPNEIGILWVCGFIEFAEPHETKLREIFFESQKNSFDN